MCALSYDGASLLVRSPSRFPHSTGQVSSRSSGGGWPRLPVLSFVQLRLAAQALAGRAHTLPPPLDLMGAVVLTPEGWPGGRGVRAQVVGFRMTLEGRTLKSRRNTWWDLETNQGHAWDGDPDPGLRCGPGVGVHTRDRRSGQPGTCGWRPKSGVLGGRDPTQSGACIGLCAGI